MLAQAFSEVQQAMGVTPQNTTDPLAFSIQDTGRLTFEVGDQEVLISLAIPLMPYDSETMAKAYALAGVDQKGPYPLWVGHYNDSLVLITATPDRGVAGKDLLQAAEFLIDLSANVSQVRNDS
ncbi:MAG: hypothetical protein IJU76_00485 [Desulfovibrionaceae bacterium]|nr:hypothetical protein [Desulfovibrionaceae bacterium]